MKIYEIGTGYTSIPAKIPAATESIVEELTKAFLQNNIDAEILDVSDKNRAPHSLPITEVKVPSVFTKSDVSLGIVHKLKRVVYSVALSSKLKKILRKTNEKVVLHFHNQYNLFFFLKLSSKRIREKAFIAYTNHNGMWSLPWAESEEIIRKRYFQEITAMEGSDAVFALNRRMYDNICAHINIDAQKVTVVDNGVNTDVYTPLSDAERKKIKSGYNLTGKTVILQVGSVNENKGQERALRMLAPILRENKDIVYAYAGGIVSEEYHQHVKETAKELSLDSQVVYLGSVSPGEEMNKIYNLATATVFVSRYEGFCLVCIESLSAGVPVVVCEDLKYELGDGCFTSSAEKIAQTVSTLISGDASSVCASARLNAESNYTWSKISADYYSFFNVD